MPEETVKLDSNQSTKQRSAARSLFRFRKARPFSEVFVCTISQEEVNGVHVKRTRSDMAISPTTISTDEEAKVFFKKLGAKCPVIVLLDKSKYLLNVFEIPQALPEEMDAMLSLEVEAHLPAEYGPVEISYLRLPCSREGYQKYQVYICRRQILEDYISLLTGLGIKANFFLPSVVVWHAIYESLEVGIDLCVAAIGADKFEAVEKGRNEEFSIRTIQADKDHQDSAWVGRGLIECVRPLLTRTRPEVLPLKIGWIGQGCPHYISNGRLAFTEIAPHLKGRHGGKNKEVNSNLFLTVTARALLMLRYPEVLAKNNMLPRALTARRQQKSQYQRLTMAAASFLLALILVFSALKIAIFRYRAVSDGLSQKIAVIKTEGESVGHRIKQLKAIWAAWETSNNFSNVLAGLYKATPPGITYSQVELNEEGEIRLRGQAESLSLPFLAPERLETQPMFEQVLLKDAGQSKRASGSITEFRIDCTLRCGEGR